VIEEGTVMAKTTRQLTAALMMTGLLGQAAPVLGGDASASTLRRVRSSSASIVSLIGQATERSETFRRLVETIDASDGIVYVEEGQCSRGVRACFVGVAEAGAHRLLRVVVDTRKAEWDLMGSIGHELRHTIEVLESPRVRSSSQMYFFYAREGRPGTGKGTFETEAAVAAGQNVRKEVRTYQRRMEEK
jgi:hypothetical protein